MFQPKLPRILRWQTATIQPEFTEFFTSQRYRVVLRCHGLNIDRAARQPYAVITQGRSRSIVGSGIRSGGIEVTIFV